MAKYYPPSFQANQTHQPPPEFRQHCAGMFAANAQGKPYLNGLEAASIFLSSGLDKTVLSNIWEQASTYKNGRFTCDEFTNAMWLIEQHKSSQIPIPPPYAPYPAPPPRPYPVAVAVQPPTVTRMDMTEPMICIGCDTGFVTNNIAYVCNACPSDKNSHCEGCNQAGKRCRHVQSASRYILERGRNLKTQDKEDELGFSYKCSKCKTKFKPDELCWHCKRCFESNLCEGCWPAREKRCRHAAKGKVQLRVVGKPASIGEILDDIGEIHDLIG